MILLFFFLSKHQNKAEFKNLHGSEALNSDFPSLKTSVVSMASTASTTSVASMTFTTLFHQKIIAPDGWIPPGNQITNTCLFLWNGSSKTQIFTDTCNFSVGGCWGQLILFFWKLVDETQISKSQDFRTTFKQILACIFLSVRYVSICLNMR